MIFSEHILPAETVRLAELAAEAFSEGPGPQGSAPADMRGDMAFAVAEYLRRELLESGGICRYSDVVFLAARSLWAVGNEAPATELLKRHVARLGLPPECMEAARAREASLPVWRLVANRQVRKRAFSALTRGEVWSVNLAAASKKKSPLLELEFFAMLGVLLEQTAFVWDNTSGAGALALRGLRDAASRLYGPRRRAEELLWRETAALCRGKFAKIAKERKWTEIPEILRIAS